MLGDPENTYLLMVVIEPVKVIAFNQVQPMNARLPIERAELGLMSDQCSHEIQTCQIDGKQFQCHEFIKGRFHNGGY